MGIRRNVINLLFHLRKFQFLKMFLICYFLFVSVYFSQAQKKQIDTCKAGVYLKALYDFNSSEFSYDLDLWMWFEYKNDSINPLKTIEIANAKNYEYSNPSIEKRNNINWACQNCKAKINQNWDLSYYPFDKQKLEIIIEESQLDKTKMLLIQDNSEFKYSKDINIKGWQVDSSIVKHGFSDYNSDFGDPTLSGKSSYSKIYYTLYLSRDSWALFFKLFTGVYVAFCVAFLVFFIKPNYVDPRFGLSIGGLFAAVGNKYVVDSNMPESISFTLVDKIHDITFVFILLTILFSIISLKLHDSGNLLRQKKFDRNSAIALFSIYFIINFVMLFNATHQ